MCEGCARGKSEIAFEGGGRISLASLYYLDVSGGGNLAAARNATLPKGDQDALKAFLFQMTENALGQKLKTLSTGSGIL